MNKVDFTYNDDKYFVQCSNDDKMKDIIAKFLSKINKERKNIVFLYNGLMINEELSFNQCANRLDRSRNYMSVVVVEGQNSNDDSVNLKKSNYIICPQCEEDAFLSIKDFKLSITGCNKQHKTEDLELKELEKTQYIDQSKILCDNCRTLKSDTSDNKFFVCINCKQKLCPKCKDKHDVAHKDYIKEYEENQFFCQIHFDEYSNYCSDCKKDLCKSCLKEHENHKFIAYESIIPDLNLLKGDELRDTKEKIYRLKTIINGMIYQLNNLNKNLDTYFDIYDSIISNFDIKKSNYYIIENVNGMKKYNNNFLGHITEIIKDNNLKSQFTNIISLQTKIDFKRIKQNKELQKKDNNSFNDIIDNKEKSNPLGDEYENFNINKMKELYSYTTKNEVEKFFILNDRRILTDQRYYDENGNSFHKLCVYSLINGFICDINMDYVQIESFYQMDDGNVIIYDSNHKDEKIKIIKIKKNEIEEIWNFDQKPGHCQKLLKDKFLISIQTDKPNPGFFRNIVKKKYEKQLYTYEKGKLVHYKDIHQIYEDKNTLNLLQVDENEYIFYTKEENEKTENDSKKEKEEEDEEPEYTNFLMFYDMLNDKIIKHLKVGKGDNNDGMILIRKDFLLIGGNSNSIILIDVKNREMVKKYNCDIVITETICLNENIFLYHSRKLYQYEFKDSNNIELKEEKDLHVELISKFPGNRLIIYDDKKITIYG